jgi:nucleotide-binding universal stress UspA family protein
MFKKILVPIDIQEPAFADKALAMAVEEAQHHKASLHVMTVLPGFGMPIVASYFPPDAMKRAAQDTKKELQEYVAKKVPADVSKIKADLIVLHSHLRKHMNRVLLGSCAQRVVEHAHCSVTVLRDN